MNDQRVIILFVKYPEKGRVKTRLARTLGDEAAVSIYCQLVSRLVRMLRKVDVEQVCVCFDPVEKGSEVEAWIRPIWLEAGGELDSEEITDNEPALIFRSQCEGDLGDRLKSAFGEIFEESRGAGITESRLVAIGSDCIEIDDQTFQSAWKSLATKDVVFGPTLDGGYYLVGMKSLHLALFEGIPWSTETTLEASLHQARKLELEFAVLEEKHDIDTEEDWRRAEAQFYLSDSGEQGDARVEAE